MTLNDMIKNLRKNCAIEIRDHDSKLMELVGLSINDDFLKGADT